MSRFHFEVVNSDGLGVVQDRDGVDIVNVTPVNDHDPDTAEVYRRIGEAFNTVTVSGVPAGQLTQLAIVTIEGALEECDEQLGVLTDDDYTASERAAKHRKLQDALSQVAALQPAVEHAAAVEVVEQLEGLVGFSQEHFTCQEAETFAGLIRAVKGEAAADSFIKWHAESDEEGDAHFD